jgi:protein O-mannosyl-transferase
MSNRKNTTQLLAAIVILVAVQIVVYSPTLQYEFLKYDDDAYVYENPNIKILNVESVAWLFAKPYYRSYTPLTFLTHAVDYKLWGDHPWGHHLGNLVLHTLNTISVFLLGLMLFKAARAHDPGQQGGAMPEGTQPSDLAIAIGAFMAAGLFSLHPMRAESVSWVSDRKDLLLTFFVLPTCMAYVKYAGLRGTPKALRWYLAAIVLFVFALFSKSIAVVVPLIFILLDLLLFRRDLRTEWKTLLLEKIPFLLLSGTFTFIAFASLGKSQEPHIISHLSAFQRVLLPFYSVVFYPVKILWPAHLTPMYDAVDSSIMFLATIAFVAITILTFKAAQKGRPYWLLAWCCYALAIAPTTTGSGAGIQPWADRYSYLPSVCIMLFAGSGMVWLWRRGSSKGTLALAGITALALALLVTSTALSMRQLPIWRNGESLWKQAMTESPALPMPYANLGVVLEDKGQPDAAIVQYRKALDLVPGYADALYNIGVAYETKAQPDSAEYYYIRAIAADTLYDDAFINLGNMYVRTGKLDKAIELFQHAVRIKPADPDPYYNMGIAYYTKGDIEKALDNFQNALKCSPSYAKAFYNIGAIYLSYGASDPAMECFKKAARLGLPEAQQVLKAKGKTW